MSPLLIMAIVSGIVVAAGAGGFWWWRRRQRSRSRLISMVALVRDHQEFDPAILAALARKAWKADLGDGSHPGEHGFVASEAVFTALMCRDRLTFVNAVPRPYVDDIEAVAQTIPDFRIQQLFLQHTAWFSCDAMGVDRSTSEEEIQKWYRHLGRLMAELLDERCLLIFLPEIGGGYPIQEGTEAALRSKSPVEALQQTLDAPVTFIPGDDPEFQKNVDEARATWPRFVEAFEQQAGTNFAIKAPITRGEHTEFIWVEVTSLEGDRIYGKLANHPVNLAGLQLGSRVVVESPKLNDWCYIDPSDQLQGGFTIAAMDKSLRRGPKGKR